MRGLKALLLGFLAVGVVLYVFAAALALAVVAAGGTLQLALGPVTLVEVTSSGNDTVTEFGAGLVLLALVGGVANAVAATVLRRRAEARHDGDAPFA